MKRFLCLLAVAGTMVAQAQAPQMAVKDPLALLKEIKAANEELLKQQQQTLKRLEELENTSRTIRIFTKRG